MTQGRRWIGVLFALAALLALAPAALAKTYHPNKRGDHVPGGCSRHDCTLREAVIAANHRHGADKIVLEAGKVYNLSRPISADNATDGDLDIGSDTQSGALTIKSSGKQLATIDANGIDGVIDISYGRTLFDHLKITGGKGANEGAGINSDTSNYKTKIVDSRISGNSSTARGGGIDTSGPMQIVRSRITGNRSPSQGGGINADGDPLSISKSTISGNHSGEGAGIYNSGSLKVLQSTISGNTTPNGGGGIFNEFGGKLNLANDTIAGNKAATGGGIYYDDTSAGASLNAVTIAYNHASGVGGGSFNGGGPAPLFKLHNSIIARNTASAFSDCDWGPGTAQSLGHNLIGNSYAGNCNGVLVSSDRHDVNARIGSLMSNGGLTKTIALKKHSPAINHAGSGMPHRDQRGHARHNPDIGAYER